MSDAIGQAVAGGQRTRDAPSAAESAKKSRVEADLKAARNRLAEQLDKTAVVYFKAALENMTDGAEKKALHLEIAGLCVESPTYKHPPGILAAFAGANYSGAGDLSTDPVEKRGLYLKAVKAHSLARFLDVNPVHMEDVADAYAAMAKSAADPVGAERHRAQARGLYEEVLVGTWREAEVDYYLQLLRKVEEVTG